MKKFVIFGLVACALSISHNAFAGYGQQGKGYSKIDLGWGVQNSKQKLTGSLTADAKDLGDGIAVGAGLGYYLLDELRVDGMLYYDRGFKSKKAVTSGATSVSVRGKEQSLGVFANIYYDFINYSNFAPYIMAGAGFLRNEFKTEITTTTLTKENKSSFDLAYQGGLGVSYHISSALDIDFGYRYIMKGSDTYSMTLGAISTTVKAETDPAHVGLIGFRSTF